MKNVIALTLLLTLSACGGDKTPAAESKPAEPGPAEAKAAQPSPAEAKAAQPSPAEAKAAPPKPEAPAAAAPDGTLKPDADGVVHVTGNDMMQFNARRIEVSADKPIKLELKHVGQLPAMQMGHNLIVLKPGNDPVQFAATAVAAKDTGYIPAEGKDKIIAHTKLLGGGESDTIEFTLPGPGTYPFLCSFPGHVGLMKGVLVAH